MIAAEKAFTEAEVAASERTVFEICPDAVNGSGVSVVNVCVRRGATRAVAECGLFFEAMGLEHACMCAIGPERTSLFASR